MKTTKEARRKAKTDGKAVHIIIDRKKDEYILVGHESYKESDRKYHRPPYEYVRKVGAHEQKSEERKKEGEKEEKEKKGSVAEMVESAYAAPAPEPKEEPTPDPVQEPVVESGPDAFAFCREKARRRPGGLPESTVEINEDTFGQFK